MASSGGWRSWAIEEFGAAELGDKRLTDRLINLAAAIAEYPGSSVPEACGTWAATKGAYRFFSNSSIDPADVFGAHRAATVTRLQDHQFVLVVQDTTYLDFSTRPATQGLGYISDPHTLGFCMHSALAVSPDGVPLGLLGQEVWARPPKKGTPIDPRYDQPTEGKESARWLRMLEASTKGLPATTRVLTVADREGDLYELFVQAAQLKQDLLVRSAYNRRLYQQQAYLWDAVEAAPKLGYLDIEISRANGAAPRTVNLELRAVTVTLNPRQYRPARKMPPIPITAVLAREHTPPTGQEAVCWLLLTTLAIPSFEAAQQCLHWYAQRWKIERYHYTLKSGCRIEDLQLETFERLHRALAVYSVVAWRLLHLTYAARMTPDEPCTVALSSREWKLLYCLVHHTSVLPESVPSLRTAMIWLARLGGFLGRRGDGEPGVKVLWRGFRRLQDMVEMWDVLQPNQ